jgi:hypothetical protein
MIATAVGMPYVKLIGRILDSAAERLPRKGASKAAKKGA